MLKSSILYNKHDSGHEMPLLCLSDTTGSSIWGIQGLPLITVSVDKPAEVLQMERPSPSIEAAGIIEKFQFRLHFKFGDDITKLGYKCVFVRKGSLLLADLIKNEIYFNGSYEGIAPELDMETSISENKEFSFLIDPSTSGLHIISRFSFNDPDGNGKERHFEFKMPLGDIFHLSSINPYSLLKRYRYNAKDKSYKPVEFLAKPRSFGRRDIDQSVQLEQNGHFVNSKELLFQQAIHKPGSLLHSEIAVQKLSGINRIPQMSLIASLSILPALLKPDLPLQEVVSDGILKDPKDAKTIWYHDKMQLITPPTGVSFDQSPFRFLFKVIGTDLQGRPVLEGSIHVTLKASVPESLNNYSGYVTKRIPGDNISVILSIPYLDQSGQSKVSDIICSQVTQKDDIIQADFLLNNDWTRIAYAGISGETANDKPVSIKTIYYYKAYVREQQFLPIVSLHKFDRIPILKSTPRGFKPNKPVFISNQNSLINPSGQSVKYETATVVATPVLMATPVLTVLPLEAYPLPAKEDFKIDTLSYSQKLEISFPCGNYVDLYQEEQAGQRIPVGCKQPYKLGEAPVKLFTELNELRNEKYRVFRSNQVPNRFLVLPTRYVISRYPETNATPFLPNLLLYSTFDVNNTLDSHTVLTAALQPDISEFKLRLLTESLRLYTSYEPELIFANEIESERSYRFVIPTELYISNSTVGIGPFIHFTLMCEVEKTLTVINMLKKTGQGLNGVVQYKLTDGAVWESAILIKITEVEGPWGSAPLKVDLTSAGLTLQNKLDTTIDVGGVYTGSGASWKYTAVNVSIPQKSNQLISLPSPDKYSIEYLVQNVSGYISEIHSYSENISCQIIFIDTENGTYPLYTDMKVDYGLENDIQFATVSIVQGTWPLEAVLPIPLTIYLDKRVIRYRIKGRRLADQVIVECPWTTMDLSTGNIINLQQCLNTYFK